MNEREWFLELAADEVNEGDEQDAISYIIEEMSRAEERARADDKRRRRVDLHPHRDVLRRLLRTARHEHREVASDWTRRNSPEGSEWRPHRQLEKNFDPEQRAVGVDVRNRDIPGDELSSLGQYHRKAGLLGHRDS